MTPPSEAARRVFISYAHKDGAALAQRLQSDLATKGFPVWFDTQRLAAGDTWSSEIERAIDDVEIAIVLLSHGSYVSEVCRGEQLRSLRKGKCVIPLKVQADCDVPVYLEARQWLDFSSPKSYDHDCLKLIAAMEKRDGAVLKPEYRTTHNNAPGLLENLVRRPDVLAALRNQLFAQGTNRNIALTALRGMGGIGKTVLAQELCHDDVVQQAFPDGVFWFTIGQESTLDFVSRLEQVPALDRLLGDYQGEEACKSQYRDVLQKKAALIVLDDVWNTNDVKPFYAESPRSRLLFTTRDASIATSFGAREVKAELLTEDESRQVLARWSGWRNKELPAEALDIIRECGRLPLALSMIGASLHGEPSSSWNGVADRLRHADLSLIEGDVAAYQHTSFLRAIQVSVEALERKHPEYKERYLALAVLLEDMEAPVEILSVLWGLDAFETRRAAKRLIDLSLAQREAADRGLRLHDLQLDYVRAQYPDKEALELIHGALRLSSNVIAKDAQQFTSQITGRLLSYRAMPAIEKFTQGIEAGTQQPWLRPLHPALHPPGTALIRTLAGHTDYVTKVALSGDGRLAVSASRDHTLKVWEVGSGRELRTLTGHKSWVNGVALSGDGRLAVSASTDKTLKVWEVESGRELRALIGHTDKVNAVALSVDGRLAVSASSDETLKVWEVKSGRELRTLTGHSKEVTGVALSGDGRLTVSASFDKTLKVWEVKSGRELRPLAGHSIFVIKDVALSGDGRLAVSASTDRTLKVWEVESGRELRTLAGHTHWVDAVVLSRDGRLAVSASTDKTLKVWEVETGRELRNLAGHTGAVQGVALSGDGRLTVSASNDNTLKVWEVDTGRELRTLVGHTEAVRGVALSEDGRLAVSASDDHTLKVWEVESGRELRTLTGHTEAVKGVALSGDGRLAVSASLDKTLKVWMVESGRRLRTLKGHTSGVYGVALNRDGRLAVSASSDETLKVWGVQRWWGRKLRTLASHKGSVYSVALSGDGRLAVSASDDNTLKVWEMKNGCELRTLAGHTNWVTGVALSGDGRLVVSASTDRTLKVWEVETGKVLATFTCDGEAHCCAFSPVLKLVVAGDAGGHVHFLRLEEPKLKR
jgi:WD40 repeat protein